MKDHFVLVENTYKSRQNKSKNVEIVELRAAKRRQRALEDFLQSLSALRPILGERWRTLTTRFQGAADCCSLVICSFEV